MPPTAALSRRNFCYREERSLCRVEGALQIGRTKLADPRMQRSHETRGVLRTSETWTPTSRQLTRSTIDQNHRRCRREIKTWRSGRLRLWQSCLLDATTRGRCSRLLAAVGALTSDYWGDDRASSRNSDTTSLLSTRRQHVVGRWSVRRLP